ncbi:signal peptidase I [Cenarchaeum symbiosum A]|uniref:Signal peptidase I n=1 Tax=Cenarchaeum symbiosum (strain A) TaxID=414004 RepID=A0RTL4_CENSY|nr:signal peptidase I [Cenarchaeum symbiosum A]
MMGGKSLKREIIKDGAIFAVGLAIIWIGLPLVFGTQNPFYVVSSGSMIPELEVYDVLIVNGNDPFSEVQVGDVIVFNRPSGQDRVIVHRVASIIDENPLTIRTKGDANPASIPGTDFPITEEEYIGQVAYVIPQIGYVTRAVMPPINYIILAVIAAVVITQYYLKSRKKKEVPEMADVPGPDTAGLFDGEAPRDDPYRDRAGEAGGTEGKEKGDSGWKTASELSGDTGGREKGDPGAKVEGDPEAKAAGESSGEPGVKAESDPGAKAAGESSGEPGVKAESDPGAKAAGESSGDTGAKEKGDPGAKAAGESSDTATEDKAEEKR